MRRQRLAAAAVIIACIVAAGCATSPSTRATADVGFGHVHGLGNNPQDGTVYAATHTGIFRLGPAGPERVAGRVQDTMGFTVVGPDRFLGSGHPGPTDTGPSDVGLIRSDDAGATWTPGSLSGQADFHGLAAAGDTVYGWDSVSLLVMRSDDAGRTWSRGAPVQGVGALAVDPDDVKRVLATTADGLMESVDGGAAFAPAAAQPPLPLVLVDLAPRVGGGGDTVLAGVDQTATAWAFSGGEWSSRGSPGGSPQAFSVLGPDRYVVATDRGVHSTEDGGTTWSLVAATN